MGERRGASAAQARLRFVLGWKIGRLVDCLLTLFAGTGRAGRGPSPLQPRRGIRSQVASHPLERSRRDRHAYHESGGDRKHFLSIRVRTPLPTHTTTSPRDRLPINSSVSRLPHTLLVTCPPADLSVPVCRYGTLDIFNTKLAPSGNFDVLGGDFNKFQMLATVVGLGVATVGIAPLVGRKGVDGRWKLF